MTTTHTFAVTGMTCGSCVAHVEEALRGVDGVESVTVDLDGASASVVASDPGDTEQMRRAIEDAGYEAALRP